MDWRSTPSSIFSTPPMHVSGVKMPSLAAMPNEEPSVEAISLRSIER